MSIHDRWKFSWKSSRGGVVTKEAPSIVVNIKGESGNADVRFFQYEDFVNEPISSLDFSQKSTNALKRGKIDTIGDLILQYDALPRKRGIGVVTINNIGTVLLGAYLKYINEKHPDKLSEVIVER